MVNIAEILDLKGKIGKRLVLVIILSSALLTIIGTVYELRVDYNKEIQETDVLFQQIKTSSVPGL